MVFPMTHFIQSFVNVYINEAKLILVYIETVAKSVAKKVGSLYHPRQSFSLTSL